MGRALWHDGPVQWGEGHQFGRLSEAAGVGSLLLLAFSGYVQGSRYISALPVSLSLIGLAGVLIFGFNSVLAATRAPQKLGVLVAMLGASAVGLVATGSPDNDYATAKLMDVFFLAPILVFGGAYLLRTPRARRYFAVGVVAVGALALTLARVDPSVADTGGRLMAEGSSTIGTGRAVGAAAVVLTVAALSQRRRLPLLAAAAVFILGAVGVASRGPLLAAAVAVVIATVFGGRRGRWAKTLVVIVGGVLMLNYALSQGVLAERLTTLEDSSATTRRTLWVLSWQLIQENPVGVGWGRLVEHVGVIANSEGWVQYPHSIIIEFTVEAGWLAGVALIVVLLTSFRSQVARARGGAVEAVMLALMVYAVVNAMVSGDVGSNRGLWVAIGAAFSAGPALSVMKLRHGQVGRGRRVIA